MPSVDWERLGNWFLGVPLRVTLIIVLAIVVRWLLVRAIRRVERGALERAESNGRTRMHQMWTDVAGVPLERRRQRATTMASVLRSVATFVIFTVAVLTIMADLGMPLGPLLASAGIGGVAVGFGAQSLVKDFLSGIFMIVEDQYGVGDMIDTGQATGTVEEVTLRVTRVRDADGVVWFIRNGEILRIGNLSQGWAMGIVDIPIAHTEDPSAAIPILKQAAAELYDDSEWSPLLLEAPSVAGVEAVTPGVITLRIFAKTQPGQQWGVQRELRRRAVGALDEADIKVAAREVPQVG